MNSFKRGNAKLLAAVVGGSAVVAFGALGVGMAQGPGQESLTSTGATVGAIPAPTTTPTAIVEESVDKAAPAITGHPAEPSGENPNRVVN